jgi:hypothetical protein
LFTYFRSNDRLKNNLIEALSRKGAALCQLYYYNYAHGIKTDSSGLREIDDIWLQVTCFISPDSDSKVC